MTTLVISCVMSHNDGKELRGTMHSYDIDWEVEFPEYDIEEA